MEYKLSFKEYNEALKQKKLLGLKCKSCGVVTVPPKMVCRSCASPDLEVMELKGNGKIQTFTTCNVAAEGREGEVPYTILLVECLLLCTSLLRNGNRPVHRTRNPVRIKNCLAVYVTRRAANTLYQRTLRTEKAFLVGIEDSDQ